jgi:diaminohydroxyphosphoribosylaminopyrimidine deaminase/5-amino-6-(5-phosphoribosylamino)uracil reductase
VIGALDPDSRVNGAGVQLLRSSGVEVEIGAGLGEALDPAYFHHRRTGRSLVTLKLAATLDGQTAAADGSSQWITSEVARLDAHELRAGADAIVIGAGTLRADDPRLDVRLAEYGGFQPTPVVVAGTEPLPATARLWSRNVIVVSTGPVDRFADVVVVRADEKGLPDLGEALTSLAERGLLAVLVEGGARLASALLQQDLIDRGILYLGGLLAGGVGRPLFDGIFPTLGIARPVTIERAISLGPDVRIDFRVHRDS